MPNVITPIFKEKPGKDWISYGADDQYGNFLEELYLGSSINSAIINGVSEMIYGEGLDARDRQENDAKKEQWLQLQILLGESQDDVLQKVCMDLKLYGQCYINTIWNNSRTRVVKLKHLPVNSMRPGVADSDGYIPLYYHNNDWSDKRSKPDVIKAFSEEDRTEASRVLQIKRYAPSFHYMGIPDWNGSTGYVQLDISIQQFHLSNISSGLFPSMLLNFSNGLPTDEEQRMIEQKVNEKFSGSSNAGRVLITFNDGTETQPTITPIQNNGSDGMYEYLSNEVTTKVLTGHRCTSPLLFGVKSGTSGFGNNADELRDSYSLFYNTVILPFQELLLNGLAPVLEASGMHLDLYFKPLKPADFMGISMEDGDDTGDYENSYDSNQIIAALEIVSKVEMNQLSKPQGIQLLVAMLGFTQEAAEEMFLKEPEEEVEVIEFSSQKAGADVADWLLERAEDEDEEYELIDSRKVDYDEEEKMDALFKFASLPKGDARKKDEQYDRDIIKVRYAYMPHVLGTSGVYKSGPNKGESYSPRDDEHKSRKFCTLMVKASIRGKVFSRTDIEAAGGQAVNPGWGPGGANTYSIWLNKGVKNCGASDHNCETDKDLKKFYKGGGSCQHFWERRTYLKKNNQRVSVNQAKGLLREAGLRPLDVNDPEVAKLPRDMRDRGFLDNRGPFTTERTPN